nr:unnamed protein product [Digitaria exilis]
MDPNRSPDAVMDDACWSDYDFCARTGNWYCCAKMKAEITATEEAERLGLHLAVVLPGMTIGMLQKELNVSNHHVLRYLMGVKRSYPNAVAAYVDVRDVARAHVLAYETPGAAGRYLCARVVLHRAQLVAMLRDLFPEYPVTAKCEDDSKPRERPYKFSNQRLKDLGLQFTPLKKSLYEAVICMQKKGHLPIIEKQLHANLIINVEKLRSNEFGQKSRSRQQRAIATTSMAPNDGEQEQLVCVTGAGSFIGSWVVRELLMRGYRVRGTARDPGDSKNAHLLELEGAKEKLSLLRADIMDPESLRAAFSGCHGVFHVASPVSNDPELVPVAVVGTRNVMSAAAAEGVSRVVLTSSYGAVHMDANRSPDAVMDETCWSDYDFCARTGNWYCCAKMMAEITATEEAARLGLQLAVVLPCMTMGPMLQKDLNLSNHHVLRYLMGVKRSYPNAVAAYVDVRDVARAHVLAYETPSAAGRYLCAGVVLHRAQLVGMLRDLFPEYPVTAKYSTFNIPSLERDPTKCEDDSKPRERPYKFSNQRLKDLGLEFTPLEKSLYEAVICMQKKGHLPIIEKQLRANL